MRKTRNDLSVGAVCWIRLGLLVAIVAGLAGCSYRAPAPLRLGIVVFPAYEMAFLARELGYFDAGSIEVVSFHSPAETLRAYNGGAIDVVALTTSEFLQVAENDPSQRIVQLVSVSDGADVVMAIPEITSLSDLAGRRVGVERSPVGVYTLQRALDHSDLTTDDITIVSTEIEEGPAYFREKRIDAVVTYEPYKTEIVKMGGHEIFSSRKIPNEIVEMLVTRQAVIDSRSGDLNVLVDGWLRAIETFHADPLQYAPALAARENLTPNEFAETFDEIKLTGHALNREQLVSNPGQLVAKLQRELTVLRRSGFLEKPIDFSSMLVGEFVKEVND